MTKSDQLPPDATNSPPATTAWGTWEELLLAYAVNRYGTTNWTSISSELRKRSSAPINLTPYYCEQKYRDLNRRFNQSDAAAAATAAAVPWLEELRNLRVLELQRELRNYDLYISSLQTKVKRLTEESEKSGGDAAVSGDYDGDGGGSDRDNQSVNGSNGNLNNGNGVVTVRTGDGKPESAAVLLLPEDDLFNIRPEGNEPVESEPDRDASEVKSEGKNSDIQSSVSKSINDRVPRGTSKEDDQSTDSIPVRSLPLVDFLLKVQKLGSVVFERRLDRQEKPRYQNLIRQHIDYETLQTRLKQGQYSDGNDKFFRDLLLLVNNTRIFFPKQSPESNAAVDLRLHILNEMILKKKQKTDSKPTHKRPVDSPNSSLLKPKLSGPIVVCRKRSSITAKAAAGSSSGKKEQTGSKGPEKLIEQTGSKKSRDSLPLINKKKGKSPVTESSDTKPEKKKLTEAEEKKQSAAKFLNRMKRSNEPSERGSSENDSRGEQRKSKGGGGGDGKKDQAGKKSSGGKQAKEQDSPGKRSVGRPPKRVAASPPLASVSGKRTRESVGSEFGSKQIKKRSKR